MSLWQQGDVYIRLLTPKIVAVLLIILSVIPLRIPGLAEFMPLFNVMIIYYWSIYRPELFPNWFVFALGIFQDALYGTPLGSTSLINLISRMAIISQRKIFVRESFLVVWSGFILFCLVISLLNWAIFSLFREHFMSIPMVLMQWVLSVVLYSCVHGVFSGILMILPDRQSHGA